jgi:hypothetical protein
MRQKRRWSQRQKKDLKIKKKMVEDLISSPSDRILRKFDDGIYEQLPCIMK